MALPESRRARISKNIATSDTTSTARARSQCPDPSTFGLTTIELVVHALELLANGWQLDEVHQVLELSEAVR